MRVRERAHMVEGRGHVLEREGGRGTTMIMRKGVNMHMVRERGMTKEKGTHNQGHTNRGLGRGATTIVDESMTEGRYVHDHGEDTFGYRRGHGCLRRR
jgi:hypothetical protein